LKYLGVPITASRLTKLDCRGLVDKIVAKARTWAIINIYFAGRAMLINSVIFGLVNYWATIFLLPSEVIERITQICRNFLWSGTDAYKRILPISWCFKAMIAKLVWAISSKKDVLWVRWMHGRSLKHQSWWDHIPAYDSSWTWRKICQIKEFFKKGNSFPSAWD